MTVDELPKALKILYDYFEQIIQVYDQLSYQRFRMSAMDAILLATDDYHDDVGPIHRIFSKIGLKIHYIIYEKNKVSMVIIFLNSYTEEFCIQKPVEVSVRDLKNLIKMLDDFYTYT